MTPEEAARAAQDLQANALLPGHVGKFSLARHSWDDPFRRITAASEGRSYRLLTPMIGSPMVLDDQQQRFCRWWEDLAQPPADRTAGASSAMRGQMGVLSKQVEIVAASKEAVALRRGDRRENQYSRFATADGVVACVKAGLGIAVVSQWMCRAELERGELERILPEYELDPVEVHAVYPAGPHPSPKVRAFSDYLSAQLGGTTEAKVR
jgi:DNA-binding transcriptional LysR family regulator